MSENTTITVEKEIADLTSYVEYECDVIRTEYMPDAKRDIKAAMAMLAKIIADPSTENTFDTAGDSLEVVLRRAENAFNTLRLHGEMLTGHLYEREALRYGQEEAE